MEGESLSQMSLQVIRRSMEFSDNIQLDTSLSKMVLLIRGKIGTLQKLQGQWWMRRIYLIVTTFKRFLQPSTLSTWPNCCLIVIGPKLCLQLWTLWMKPLLLQPIMWHLRRSFQTKNLICHTWKQLDELPMYMYQMSFKPSLIQR